MRIEQYEPFQQWQSLTEIPRRLIEPHQSHENLRVPRPSVHFGFGTGDLSAGTALGDRLPLVGLLLGRGDERTAQFQPYQAAEA